MCETNHQANENDTTVQELGFYFNLTFFSFYILILLRKGNHTNKIKTSFSFVPSGVECGVLLFGYRELGTLLTL